MSISFKRKILILGAGVYQIPLIQKALNQCHHVCVASWNDKDPGMLMAHDPWKVDIRDGDTLLRLALKKKIDAVVTTGTDVCIPALGKICDHLSLPGISARTALNCSNKILMQKKLTAYGVPTAPGFQVKSLHAAAEAAEAIAYPVIIKAPDSSGSRGITAAFYPEELKAAWNNACQISQCESVLVEKLLCGVEFGCQIIVVNGEVVKILFHNDTVTSPPISVPVAHSCPFYASDTIEQQTARICARAVKALKIDHAICNMDLMRTSQGIFLLEIGARVGATGIPEIIKLYYGIDLYDIALRIALGETFSVSPKPDQPCAYTIIQASKTGILLKADIPEFILKIPDVLRVDFDVLPKDRVRKFKFGPDRIGNILTKGATAREAEEMGRFVASHLTIDVADN